MIDGINSTTNQTEFATQKNSEMDKDSFLKLMIAQLQNQDPLEPMDGTDYSAQLAQFSSLEQLQNINDSINMSIDANYLLTQSINNTMTAGLIGKEAKIASDTISYKGQESTNFGYELIADASELEIKIYDSNNVLVKTMEDLELTEGQHKLSWDFTDNNGDKVKSGDYRIEVKAKNLSMDDMDVAQYLVGNIDGVRFSASGTSLVINGLEYDVSDVFEIVGSVLPTNISSGETSDEGLASNDDDESSNDSNNGDLYNGDLHNRSDQY